MEDFERHNFDSYTKSWHNKKDLRKFQWNVEDSIMSKIDYDIINLVPEGARVLEVGCGDGRLAKRFMQMRSDVSNYLAIEFVKESFDVAKQRNIPNVELRRANYWDVLLEDGDWNFVISQGVLFTCTNKIHKTLLMNLLDNTADRGYILLTIFRTKPRKPDLFNSLQNSVNVIDYYFDGERTLFKESETFFNTPIWLIRDSIKNKRVPEVPKFLLGMPESDSFEEFFV